MSPLEAKEYGLIDQVIDQRGAPQASPGGPAEGPAANG
jgi:ATP-dependent protease ClpP protease subunit